MNLIFGTLVSVLLFAETITGLHVICPTEPITVEEGGDVKLQCEVVPGVDLLDLTVDWQRDDVDQMVHVYRHRRDDPLPQTPRFKGRTTLHHEDLSRGNITLLITSMQMSDAGPYRCFVPKRRVSCIITLHVVKHQPNMTTTTSPPPGGQTKPHVPDGENRNTARALILSFLTILCLLLVLGLVLKFRATRNQEHDNNL